MMDDEPVIQPSTYPVYSKQFITKPHLVLEHSHKVKKQIDDFIHAFSKRSDAELTYQKNLNDCAKLLEKYIDVNSEKSVSYVCSAFKVSNEQRGNQAKDLSDTIKTQIIIPMSEASKNFGELIKKSEKTLKKINKEYSYFADNFKRSLENYNENDFEGKELVITKHIYRFTSQFTQEKKNKLLTKTIEGIKEKMDYEKAYRNSVTQYNEVIELYRKQTTEMLNDLEMTERANIKTQSDAIRKLIVAEVSMFKNVEYDLINISKQMEKMYAENDILSSQKQIQQIPVSQQSIKDLVLKHVEADRSLLTMSLRSVEEDYYPWLLNLKKNKILRKVIESRMKELLPKSEIEEKKEQSAENQIKVDQSNSGDGEQKSKKQEALNESKSENAEKSQGQIEKKQKQQITKEIESKNSKQNEQNTFQKLWKDLPKDLFTPPNSPALDHMQTFTDFKRASQIINGIWMFQNNLSPGEKDELTNILSKSHFMRIMVYLFIEQYRIQHHVLMKWNNYQRSGQIIKITLEISEKYGDVFTIKGLLGLIFTFFSIQNQQAKKLLYQLPQINQCEIWKRQDYWQASIFQSTFEQMANFTIQKGETLAQTFLRQKNMIFSQLASYCHYMLMLGSSSKNVRRIVGRYCRLYEMSDDQNRDLSKMISNTTKQLKQAQLLKIGPNV